MAYRIMNVAGAPPHVLNLIARLEDHYLRDVHSLFRLPVPNYRITAGCNFAIAQTLLAVISGLPVTLYRKPGNSGEKFKGLLIDHFPWSDEPAEALKGVSAAEAIYSVFRNPLTHDLGLDLERKAATASVKIKRYVRDRGRRGLTEREVAARENSTFRPKMSGTVTAKSGSLVLLVDALYWGLRVMVERMARDSIVTRDAEAYLSKL